MRYRLTLNTIKKMKAKTLIFSALLALGITSASAQEAGKFRFGVTAGMNVSNLTGTEMDSRIGFNLGVRGDYNFTDKMYLGAGVIFSQKGASLSEEYTEEWEMLGATNSYSWKEERKATPGYLEIPIHFGYRFYKSDNISVFGEVGPYFAFGLSGKAKVTTTDSDGDEEEDKYDYFGSTSDVKEGKAVCDKRFDFGIGLRVGVEFSKVQVSLGYERGLTKLYDYYDANDKKKGVHNSNFMVGVSYMF